MSARTDGLDEFWTWRMRFWHRLHVVINGVAHRFVKPHRATHPVWRLNGWVANHWVEPWLRDIIERGEKA